MAEPLDPRLQHKEPIIWPDIATERRNEFGQKVRDCPKCKGPIVRKYT